jgi:hypothetical protein
MVNGSPQIMLLTVDSYEDFIDIECVAIALVFSLQAASINGAKLDAPEADRFSTDNEKAPPIWAGLLLVYRFLNTANN